MAVTTAHPPHLIRRFAAFIQRHRWWFVAGLMLLTTMLAYGDALRLPFFFDDMTHYVWLRGHTLVSIFLTAAGRPYYRPMQYFLWKLYETLAGQDSVVGYHALTLIVQVVNATLVVLLARRLTRRTDLRALSVFISSRHAACLIHPFDGGLVHAAGRVRL
jgi:hypothetical protein